MRARLAHGLAGGLQDVDPVNGRRVHDAHADGQASRRMRSSARSRCRSVSAFKSPMPVKSKSVGEDDTGGDDGAGQRPAPDLVQSGDDRVAVCTGQSLKQPEVSHTTYCPPTASPGTNEKLFGDRLIKGFLAVPGKPIP